MTADFGDINNLTVRIRWLIQAANSYSNLASAPYNITQLNNVSLWKVFKNVYTLVLLRTTQVIYHFLLYNLDLLHVINDDHECLISTHYLITKYIFGGLWFHSTFRALFFTSMRYTCLLSGDIDFGKHSQEISLAMNLGFGRFWMILTDISKRNILFLIDPNNTYK